MTPRHIWVVKAPVCISSKTQGVILIIRYSSTCGPTLILLRGNSMHVSSWLPLWSLWIRQHREHSCACVATLWTLMCSRVRTLRRRSHCHGIDNHQQTRVKDLRLRYHGQVLWDVPWQESRKQIKLFQQTRGCSGLGHRWVNWTCVEWAGVSWVWERTQSFIH